MINYEQLKKEINKIDFDKYPAHYPYVGLDCLEVGDPLIVDIGGGGTVKNVLNWICDNRGGKLITLDLCTEPRTEMVIGDESMGDSGAGDYSSKTGLYQQLQAISGIDEIWTYHNMGAYEYFTGVHEGDIDLYFDDGTHHSEYLIPLFNEVLKFCGSEALVGTHDKEDPEMKDFVDWLKKNPLLEIANDKDSQSLIMRVK